MTTALITHAECLDHVTPEGHPERVARLEHVLHALAGLDLIRERAPQGRNEDILRVHPEAHLDHIRKTAPLEGRAKLDAETWMSVGSLNAAYRAVGAVTRGVDMVMGGEAQNVFCAIRPPGHHAEAETPMGFCLFGNAAIAAKYALDHHGLDRVAIVDFDVHHGNGTQDLLWDEARVLTVTSQQMPLWPGSGGRNEQGSHGQVVNVPLEPDSGGAEMRAAYEKYVFPRLRKFEPQLIVISAGFDAHRDDPLANLNWVEDDFRWITRQLCAIADETAEGRVVSTLEGGYDLQALAASTKAHVEALQEAGK